MHAQSAKQLQTDNVPRTSSKGKFVRCAAHAQTSYHNATTCREFKQQSLDQHLETLENSCACLIWLGAQLKIQCNIQKKSVMYVTKLTAVIILCADGQAQDVQVKNKSKPALSNIMS